MYLNGVAVATQTETAVPVPNDAQLTFGRTIFGEPWKGMIDDPRIYKRALSKVEIIADMNAAR
jgi:hypothetical protein